MTDTTTDPAGDLSDFDWSTVQRIDGGFRVKENAAGTHWVDVLQMIYNWRIALTPKAHPLTIDRHWCYSGNDIATAITAILAAADWDGALDTEPKGWNKNGQTGEYRRPENS